MASEGDRAAGAGPRLGGLGLGLLIAYAALAALSFPADVEAPGWPLLAAVGLLALASVLYLTAAATVLGTPPRPADEPRRLRLVLGYALLYRLVLLPSPPLQETDYYRYLWDGRVLRHGLNPYRYAPAQVEYLGPIAPADSPLAEQWRLVEQSDTTRTIFERVHYRGVPTAYPPLAQLLFALSAVLTPVEAPVWLALLVLKGLLLVFDLGTVGLLIRLLRRLGRPASACLIYAWCPLVLKEAVNSAHFDVLAVFFTLLALERLLALGDRPSLAAGGGGMAALALAVLAKSYPLVLAPVATAFLAARLRARAVLAVLAGLSVLAAGYLPFLTWTEGPGLPERQFPVPSHPASGLGDFLSQWESNDLIFMLVSENLRRPRQPSPWFVLVPAAWRQELHDTVLEPAKERLHLPLQADPALLLAQAVLGLILLALWLRWAWQVYRQPRAEVLLNSAFLSLAWGWLLSAAANPWYVLWFLPLAPFARQRSWLLLPGLVLLYYVGFWLDAHAPAAGELVVWLEFVPFFLALAVETRWRRHQP